MGIFGSVGAIIGAAKGKKASKKAAKAQIAAMEKGVQETGRQFDVTSGQYEPYRLAGEQALGGYGDLLGLGGADAQGAAIRGLRESPFFKSLYSTGEEAVLQNAAATGGVRGGNTIRGLADFGEDTLMKTIEHQLQGLGGVMGQGMQSVGELGRFGAQKSAALTDLFTNQGQAKAEDYMRRAQLTAQMWKGIGGIADQGLSFAAGGFGAPGGGFNLGAAMKSPGGQSLFGGL